MNKYTVKQLAKLAGITVRTLHYYDEIGLLKPHRKSDKNYRFYTEFELLKLQQILFYKELNYSLEVIKSLLSDPKHDFEKSLTKQKTEIQHKIDRLSKLLATVDKTLYKLNHNTMLKDEELYEGLDPKFKNEYRQEAIEKWGDEVKKSENRLRKLTPEQLKEIKIEGDMITRKLADLMDNCEPSSTEAQQAIKEWYRHLHHFYEVSEERFRGLGKMYAEDPRFRATYDKYKKDLADFINEAIQIFCDRGMEA